MRRPICMTHDLAALRWLLTSPPLLSEQAAQQFNPQASIARFTAQEQQTIDAWLLQVQAQPHTLNDFLNQARGKVRGHQPGVLRLGRYAEKLLEFFLLHGPTHRLAAANVPLRHPQETRAAIDHTTRGEIDFLLYDAKGTPLHWELAVKYFLCHAQGDVAHAEDFIGPDAAETFSRKLTKLFARQLAHTPPAPYDATHWQPRAFARGWMFYRHGRAIPTCDLLNLAHCKGWWLPLDELDALPNAHYMLLDRQHWMPQVQRGDTQHALRLEALRQQLRNAWANAREPHVSALLIVRLDDAGAEVARYFVQPSIEQTKESF
jgi:uncharacterized protein